MIIDAWRPLSRRAPPLSMVYRCSIGVRAVSSFPSLLVLSLSWFFSTSAALFQMRATCYVTSKYCTEIIYWWFENTNRLWILEVTLKHCSKKENRGSANLGDPSAKTHDLLRIPVPPLWKGFKENFKIGWPLINILSLEKIFLPELSCGVFYANIHN
jgi:hypothetical protein